MNLIDLQFVNQLSPYVSHFVKKSDTLWNFRCPFCGDSKKSQRKARGYILVYNDVIFYKCHNCGKSLPFPAFLKALDYNLFQSYSLEQFKAQPFIEKDDDKNTTTVSTKNIFADLKIFKSSDDFKITKISSLNPRNEAWKIIRKRKIPNSYHPFLFYCTAFKHFVNSIIPEKFNLELPDSPRLIIPFLSSNNRLIGFQGRDLVNSDAKYLTIMLDHNYPKIFGLNRFKTNERAYLLEGPFDSMFLPNSLAFCGLDFDKMAEFVTPKSSTLILDNEPHSSYVVSHMKTAIEKGYSLFFWPQSIKEKDINEYICAGHSEQDVLNLVKFYTKSGLSALAELSKWRKC